jgi:hypothetical protein
MGLLCDYSAIPLLFTFGFWVLVLKSREAGAMAGLRAGATFSAGAAGPILVLFAYQYLAFGNPFLPAQAYMPATSLSVEGWHGFRLPSAEVMWKGLFSSGYGLFAFCPMLLAAFFAPRYRHTPSGLTAAELALVFGASLSLYLFSATIAFAELQWNTGVRYLVPAAALLFVALVPVLIHMRAWLLWALVVPTVTISWCVSMAREDVAQSLLRVFVLGFQLPWHTVLQRTATGYFPALANGGSPLPVFVLTGAIIWLIWARRAPSRHM